MNLQDVQTRAWLANSQPASRLRQCSPIALTLLAFISIGGIDEPWAAQSDDQQPSVEPAAVFETLVVHRKVRLPGRKKVERQIGDYAVARHDCCSKVGKYRTHKRKFRFSLEVVSADGRSVRLKGNGYTAFHEDPDSKRTFFGDMWAFFIDEEFGVTDPYEDASYYFDAYKRTVTATLVPDSQPGETWELQLDEQWEYREDEENAADAVGTLSNGLHTVTLTGRSDPDTSYSTVEVYDNGEVLGRSSLGPFDTESTYQFRAGLDPDLKLAILAGMEVFVINQSGKYKD